LKRKASNEDRSQGVHEGQLSWVVEFERGDAFTAGKHGGLCQVVELASVKSHTNLWSFLPTFDAFFRCAVFGIILRMPRVPGLRNPYDKVGRLVYFGRMLDKCTSPEGVNDARKPARNVAEYPRVTATT